MELLRQGTTLSVMLYTGRTLEQLRRLGDPLIQRCLASVDILVDGPYVDELNDGAGWRGSSNQVLHALGPRAGVLDNGATIQRRVELVVNASGLVSFTGIPGRGRARALLDRLEQCAANSEQRESP